MDGNEIGVGLFVDVVVNDGHILVVGNDVKIDVVVFGGKGVQRL